MRQNLEGILEFLHSIGKTNIVIAESPANGSAMDGFANYGYDKLAAKYKVKLVNLDTEAYEVVHVHRPEGLAAARRARGDDADGPEEQLCDLGGEVEDA